MPVRAIPPRPQVVGEDEHDLYPSERKALREMLRDHKRSKERRASVQTWLLWASAATSLWVAWKSALLSMIMTALMA